MFVKFIHDDKCITLQFIYLDSLATEGKIKESVFFKNRVKGIQNSLIEFIKICHLLSIRTHLLDVLCAETIVPLVDLQTDYYNCGIWVFILMLRLYYIVRCFA